MTVELYDPNCIRPDCEYAAPAGAQLTYRGGPLLKAAKIFGVFVDAGNGYPGTTSNDVTGAALSGYLNWLASSDVVAELAEYNVGLGSYTGSVKVNLSGSTPPPPPPPPPPTNCDTLLNEWLQCMGYDPTKKHGKKSSLELPHRIKLAGTVIQDSDIQKLISDNIAAGVLPTPDEETLYACFFPSGVTIQLGQDASCSTFCGYHSNFTLSGGDVFYAVLPYPDCAGCLGGMTAMDALTSVTSHEVCEAITDPIPGSGWYDDTNGEIGDICAWQTRQDGGYAVQLEWSNKNNACI